MSFSKMKPVALFCPNCGHKVVGYQDEDGAVRLICDSEENPNIAQSEIVGTTCIDDDLLITYNPTTFYNEITKHAGKYSI